MLVPRQKVKVFISSICGNEKYDVPRSELKKKLEDTNMAQVYLFEEEEASALSAEQHYLWALQECDLCVFLIDNADGINQGVQREIDCAKKYSIKSLYYFCDEKSKEMTPVQKSLIGAKNFKSRQVHKFDDLFTHSAQAVIDDIALIYKRFCSGYIDAISDKEGQVQLVEDLFDGSLIVPKAIIKNTDKCKKYFRAMFTRFEREVNNTSDLDEWGLQFLSVVFEHASIRSFNVRLFLNEIKKYQSSKYFEIVEMRWKAIEFYFSKDLVQCVKTIEEALKIAKKNKVSDWIVNDILIDLRNYSFKMYQMNNEYCMDDYAQKELDESKNLVYYPLLDRLNNTLHEKFIKDLYKEKIKSPYTVQMGYTISQTDILSDCFIVAMFNGSLTHLLLLHNEVKYLAFWLSCKFDDWRFKKLLLKETIFGNNQKEIDNFYRAFPDVFVKLNDDDSMEIYDYCNNAILAHEKLITKIQAFGVIGLYLSDCNFSKISSEILSEIESWLDSEEPNVMIGDNLFNNLMTVCYRIDQEVIANLCINFIDKEFSHWYYKMYDIISHRIDISTLPENLAKTLIDKISSLIPNEMNNLYQFKNVLITFRNQSKDLTQQLDIKIKENMPEFYKAEYALETIESEKDDLHFIKENIKTINNHNKTQGANGIYFKSANYPHVTLLNILRTSKFIIQEDILGDVLGACCETVFSDTQDVVTKCQAIDILIYLFVNYPELDLHNKSLVQKIKSNLNVALNISNIVLDLPVSDNALKFSYYILLTCFDNEAVDLYEILPYINDDVPTLVRVSRTIINYLEINKDSMLLSSLETIFLQSALNWSSHSDLDVRCNAVKILFYLLRNPQLKNIISVRLIHLVDNDNVYIKNRILRNISNCNIDSSTQDYIFMKCSSDPNYLVRKVCKEVNME